MTKEAMTSMIMLVVMFAVFYFLIIRPQKKKEKQIQNMRNALKVGDEIVTIGGIYGKIIKIKDDRLIIQTGSDRAKVELAKWSVSNTVGETAKAAASKDKDKDKEKEDAKEAKPSPKTIKKLGKTQETAESEGEPSEETGGTKTAEE